MAQNVNGSSMTALYGSIAIRRAICPSCKRWAFVTDEEMACCGADPPTGHGIGRMSGSADRRRLPSAKERAAILAHQHGSCFYCGSTFGDMAIRKLKTRILRAVWDHVEPFCWQSNNQTINFVAACSICNGIKSSKMFSTSEDAIAYVWHRRKSKGWESETEKPHNSDMRSLWRPVPQDQG